MIIYRFRKISKIKKVFLINNNLKLIFLDQECNKVSRNRNSKVKIKTFYNNNRKVE
jgi:hypothetical protein